MLYSFSPSYTFSLFLARLCNLEPQHHCWSSARCLTPMVILKRHSWTWLQIIQTLWQRVSRSRFVVVRLVLTTCSTNAVSLVCRMVACFNLGFVCWTLGLVGWAAPWSFYFSFSVVLQSNWPSRSAPSLGYLSGDWKGFHWEWGTRRDKGIESRWLWLLESRKGDLIELRSPANETEVPMNKSSLTIELPDVASFIASVWIQLEINLSIQKCQIAIL